jgi:hypothetical protein
MSECIVFRRYTAFGGCLAENGIEIQQTDTTLPYLFKTGRVCNNITDKYKNVRATRKKGENDMRVEITMIDGRDAGFNLVAEDEGDRILLQRVRNLYFLADNKQKRIQYDGVSTEKNNKSGCMYFLQRQYAILPPESETKQLIQKMSGKYVPQYIKVIAEEPGEEYHAQALFENGAWDFERMPSINTQIHALTVQGIGLIKNRIAQNGNINFGQECDWCALYINHDGYAENPYFRRIELEANGKLSVLLSDAYWLYEDDLTTTHIMDILSLLHENDEQTNR